MTIHQVPSSHYLAFHFYVGVALIFCVGTLGTFIIKAFYNVFLHPLSAFPGPLLARASRIYYSYYRSIGKLEIITKELHDKYGDVVRVAPDELSFISGMSWDDIYGFKSKKRPGDRLEKEPFFYMGAIAPNGEKNLGASSNADHSRIRGVLSHAFSEKALYSQETVLVHHIQHMVRRIRQHHGAPTDAVRWLHHCTYDIISDLALGVSAGALDCDEWNHQAHLIFEGIKEGIAVIEILRFMPYRRQMMHLLMWAFGRSRRRAFEGAVEKARMRMATGNYERPDFMSYILEANDTSKALTPTEITANVALLLDVGSETTASLLAGCLFYLTKNPDILGQLTTEIREQFARAEEMDSKKLSRLPYLQAVLHESLRIYPPVAGATPRVTPPSGCIIDGHFIPGNTTVAINQYATYRASANFKDALEFAPERWLGDGRFQNDKRILFQPFSHGARNCLGRNLAWAEMRLILGYLLWNFDLELQPSSGQWDYQRTWFIWDKPDLMVRFKEYASVQ
ncbi:benzoate 4-monooxygenase cytochrome [Colletotrichum incanum]|uniref:Benzoate 4-monooxygenase cytochrome n=1 Tax=Colletotrichum incanum TaxID=1573173 RepID=A0A166Y5B0_COLIC|nr:benzoate 4-monooxygenase cytochrome [Colletotrichum incanum]